MAATKKVALSARLKKLTKSFKLADGQFKLPDDKVAAWDKELKAIPAAERPSCAQELIAVAIRFEREGGAEASMGVAQLYFLAAGLLADSGKAKASPKSGSGGWGSKK